MSVRRAHVSDLLEQCHRLAQQADRLRPGQPQIAAFDADGTLWGPDVAELLWGRILDERALDRRAVAPIARVLRGCGAEPSRDPYADFSRLMDLFMAGRCSEEQMTRVMLEGLAGMREEALYALSGKAVSGLGDVTQTGEAARMVEHLRTLGFHVVVVSGSPRWAIETAVRPLGIERSEVIAGQVAVVDSVLTDGIIEPLPYGKGKIQAILRRYGRVPIIAAGNGLADLPMLEGASHLRLLVNPTAELLRACDDIRTTTWSMGAGEGKAATARAAGSPLGGPSQPLPPPEARPRRHRGTRPRS
ncbi:MAG TPA: HAD family hydrolase [Candidatus Polarisedimenticolia bacterium]|nr:HAD family hydrolase [Candidatus Polarisedimenticolia bacterium]